ncbi:phosphodiester glycosidase family protein [Pseudodonghicola flavimaris]|uniref:Phosphodiester glycosidase family protein n=1 Tax=Pseudodonghicola flavimaris TaxID=3050036 RepID=A0ABT7EWN7_9RHOB|nr:phosphodiester glycosidase family protein [Pseudodonghicola flavimaris]MDK3016764.1 phosphodiester glycosidase family protein [Pseudodonghicola flavimaris]
MIRAALILLGLSIASAAGAVECRDTRFEGNLYTLCEVDAAQEDLRLFLRDEAGEILGQFGAVNDRLAAAGKKLVFAMNAGMYHQDRSPVGHYVENGEELMRVIPNAGPGNFGLLPNGVFCIRPGRADVFETRRFIEEKPACRDATQSGPMLVIDGELHPRFLPDSTSHYVRNGVGTSADGRRAVFVLSRSAVTFYDFGRFFRDALQLPQALYFDGNVSRLYAPGIGRNDPGFDLGPIVGVVEPAG